MSIASDRIADAFLDLMRRTGDPLADAVIHELFVHGSIGAVNRVMRPGALSGDLPPVVEEYLQRSDVPADVDREKIRRAEAVFALHGPAILAVLGFCSLPASFAARNGVQVLH